MRGGGRFVGCYEFDAHISAFKGLLALNSEWFQLLAWMPVWPRRLDAQVAEWVASLFLDDLKKSKGCSDFN